MKEIYDFCQSKNLRAYILYIYRTTKKSFDDKFSNIYNLLFILKNNNKLMLKLVEYCNEEYLEKLNDFIINFRCEDTINSSFIQEE